MNAVTTNFPSPSAAREGEFPMLSKIISWSLNHRALVLLGTLVICVVGGWSLARLNIDAFPDTTPVQVQINTAVPALVPEEVERQVTFPIEMAMSGMPGLANLRSISQFGLSQVVVTFDDGTDIYFARQLINERLTTVELPAGIDRPEMGPVSTGLGEVFHYLLLPDGEDGADLTTLRTTQDWVVTPALRPVRGTAEVNTWGGTKKQYQVRIDPTRLHKYGLTFDEVVEAVRANNLNVGGGNIRRNGDMLLVHGIGRTVSIPEIQSIVITARNGVPILMKHVSEVVIGHEIRRGAVTANGQGEAVLGLSFMLMGENSYAVTNRMAEKFREVQANLPEGVKAVPVYDRTELVDEVIQTVRKNLAEGALLVIALLFIFLGNLRAGLVAASAIPISLLFGFSGMYQAGIAGTLLSLGAIDFGIVVDSSVVVIENIIRRLGHWVPGSDDRTRLEVIRDAAIEVRTPTVYGQLIIMIVYLPILSLEGVEGKLFQPMALTVVFILLGSLLLSLTLTPVLASLLLPKKIEEKEVLLVRGAKRLYQPLLGLILRQKLATVGVAAGLLVAAAVVARGLGTEFIPQLSEGAIVVGMNRPPGTSLEESVRRNTRMEQALLKAFPDEISHLWTRQGGPEVATDAGAIESSDIFISLTPRSKWTKAGTQSELVVLMERELDDFVGQSIWFTQPIEMRINEMISGVRADVALKLFGDNFDTLLAKGAELERILEDVPGCADLTVEQVTGQPILQVRLNQEQIARYGVTAQSVLALVESLGGTPAGEVMEDQLRFPLVVRMPESLRNDPDAIRNLLVTTPSGERVPLSRLATVVEKRGPKLISREWSQRRLTLQCNVRGRDVGSFVADAQRRIRRDVDLPRGYRIEWGGQFENMQRAQRRLTIVVPLALLLIVGLLYLTYRNLPDAARVFVSVPFACVGGVAALWVRGMPLSISAAVGFITLSGVSVLSSMVLLSFFRQELDRHACRLDALRAAAATALRTVLMTSMVASVGFVPMAFSSGAGAEVQRPLATVVIGGVISSTLFTLFVLPVLLAVSTESLAPLKRLAFGTPREDRQLAAVGRAPDR